MSVALQSSAWPALIQLDRYRSDLTGTAQDISRLRSGVDKSFRSSTKARRRKERGQDVSGRRRATGGAGRDQADLGEARSYPTLDLEGVPAADICSDCAAPSRGLHR